MARDITEKAVRALLAGQNFKQSNTRVEDGSMYLFGNIIATKEGRKLKISLCGWNTVTTRERLNGLPRVNIKQVKGIPYLNGEPMNTREVYKVAI